MQSKLTTLQDRHGPLIAEAWRLLRTIGRARNQMRATRHTGELELLRKQIGAARNIELYCGDFDADLIVEFFDLVERPMDAILTSLDRLSRVSAA